MAIKTTRKKPVSKKKPAAKKPAAKAKAKPRAGKAPVSNPDWAKAVRYTARSSMA